MVQDTVANPHVFRSWTQVRCRTNRSAPGVSTSSWRYLKAARGPVNSPSQFALYRTQGHDLDMMDVQSPDEIVHPHDSGSEDEESALPAWLAT
ncbi:hypothetical protein Tdes44962_MAKER03362 [Teratosphaeria destructans]|uniref:Uncharacterized protein n=1 Tax=Teratosphaeria destructans TaxID=418781 RepID=A0A9W7W1S1_9PEZI|nr:hypothetical protein Tdes44962_MAKER03362 [Teratosphaeria destructans]